MFSAIPGKCQCSTSNHSTTASFLPSYTIHYSLVILPFIFWSKHCSLFVLLDTTSIIAASAVVLVQILEGSSYIYGSFSLNHLDTWCNYWNLTITQKIWMRIIGVFKIVWIILSTWYQHCFCKGGQGHYPLSPLDKAALVVWWMVGQLPCSNWQFL